MIRGSDGLDYENLTEKLLGNPAKTNRNGWVKRLDAQGRTKVERKLWIDTYDRTFAREQVQDLAADYAAATAADRALSAHRIAERVRKHVAEVASQRGYDLPAPTAQSRSRSG